MILTITGPSASGKTSLAKALRAKRPDIGLLRSTTTRIQRPSDMPGEYEYVDDATFSQIEATNDFLWVVEVHGHRYGTRKSEIDASVQSGLFIAILTVQAVVTLRTYLESIGRIDRLLSVYLDIEDEKMLHDRLVKRGDSPEDIEIRINECKTWAKQRDASGAPFRIFDAHGDSELLASEIFTDLPQA